MGSWESVKCRDVHQEWQQWHSQMAWPDLASSIKMLRTICYHSQCPEGELSFLGARMIFLASLPWARSACHTKKKDVWSTDCYIKPKRDLHVPLDQRNLWIFWIFWNPFCFFSANLVWGNGCREPRPLPVSNSSEVFLSGTSVAVLTPRITPKYTFVYSIFSISMVLKSIGNFILI